MSLRARGSARHRGTALDPRQPDDGAIPRAPLHPGPPRGGGPPGWARLTGLEPSGLGLAGRPLSRLVGRQDELGILRALLDRADRGQGQAVGLIGEPGVGKSRLVYEFRESLSSPPVTYLERHCMSSGTTTPYGPVLEFLRQALGTSELDASTVITEKVRQRLESLGIESDTSSCALCLRLLRQSTSA